MTTNKRKSFSIEDKNAIIQRLEAGESNVKIAKDFGTSHSTISTIKKNKRKIEHMFKANVLKAKRVRVSTQQQVEVALLQWYKLQRNRGVFINGPMLQEKANYFANELDIHDFYCSASWIARFKSRNNLVVGKIAKEQSNVIEWQKKVWPNLRAKFTDEEIFNADETGLFYKLMPDNTFIDKDEKCLKAEDRLTVMVAANMSGTIKKKLLIIGKSKNPRSLQNVLSLPVDYATNHNAWMTSDIFIKWLRDWDHELTKQKKKILLLVDNSIAHTAINDLKRITLIFLPPNTTSAKKPMNQGILRALKSNYRKNLVLKNVTRLEASEDTTSINHPEITVLDAILMIYDAWNKLTKDTIFNGFKHAGFVRDSPIDHAGNDDDVPLSAWVGALNRGLPIEDEAIQKYDAVDNNIATCEEPSEEYCLIKSVVDSSEDNSDDLDDDPEENWTIPSISEALQAAEVLNAFVHSSLEDETIKSIMSRLHNAIRVSYYQQSASGPGWMGN